MIYFKEIQSSNGKIVILCDKDLLGKVIDNKEFRLEINDFYKGKIINEDDIRKEIFENTLIIHAIGEKSVNILKKCGILEEREIKYINNIPIVMIFYV